MTDQELKDLVASLAVNQKKTDKLIRELRESQKQTDEQMKETGKLIRELRESQKQTDKQIDKTDKSIKELRESQKQTDKQIDKTGKQLKKTIQKLDWMWVTQWDISEDIFSENIEDILFNAWKEITSIEENVEYPWKVEIDMICINGTEAFAVEVKTKLTQRHINKFIDISLPRLRKYFPKYDKYKLYWMVAWRTIEKWVEDYAEKKWLYVIKEMHNWKAQMLSKKDFKPKEYVVNCD